VSDKLKLLTFIILATWCLQTGAQTYIFRNNYYKHLEGKNKNGQLFNLELKSSNYQITGYLQNISEKQILLLDGEAKNQNIDVDIVSNGQNVGKAKIVYETDSTIKLSWFENKKLLHEISFIENYKTSMAFENLSIENSKKLLSTKNSPHANIAVSILYPSNNKDKIIASKITKEINGFIFDDKSSENIKLSLHKFTNNYFNDYIQSNKEIIGNGGSVEFEFMNWERSINTEILYNKNNILQYAVSDYEFSGGAHGNYSTLYYIYNLKNGNRVFISDLFLAGYEKYLSRLIHAKLKDKSLYSDEVPISENFLLLPNGILFSYPPYSIAPYSEGQIEALILYKDIITLIKSPLISLMIQQ